MFGLVLSTALAIDQTSVDQVLVLATQIVTAGHWCDLFVQNDTFNVSLRDAFNFLVHHLSRVVF